MCGRYTIHATYEKLKALFGLTNNINFPASYNAAPSQRLPIVIGNEVRLHEWGLRPRWAKEKKMRPQINARSETVDEKPFFRDAFKSNRCLIPANGFFEWSKIKGGKQPWYFTNDNELMAFAGIYNEEGFCVLTKEAIDPVKNIHGRMPVILHQDSFQNWLRADINHAKEIIQDVAPYLTAQAVSDRVNSTTNNDEMLIERSQLF